MGKRRWLARVAIAALLMGAASARADYPLGFYLGGGIGWTNVSVEDDDGYDYDCCYYYGADYDDGEDDVGFSAHAGYRFMPYFAAEVGYIDGGEPKWDHRNTYVHELDDTADTQVQLDMQAAQLSGLAILPFSGIWEAYARIGAAFWWADAEQVVYPQHDDVVYTRAIDDEGTSFLFGIGIGASPTPAWHLRLEYQSFPVEEDLLVANGDSTVDTLLLELQFRSGR